MNDVPLPATDPRQAEILDLFAREAHIERSRLDLSARADELGLSSLDVAMALFEIEDRFDIDLPEPLPGTTAPTVGELVAQVIACIDRKAAAIAPAGADATGAPSGAA